MTERGHATRVVLAPDKFKGSLTAAEVAEALAVRRSGSARSRLEQRVAGLLHQPPLCFIPLPVLRDE
jgi:hypothetical protein